MAVANELTIQHVFDPTCGLGSSCKIFEGIVCMNHVANAAYSVKTHETTFAIQPFSLILK